MDQRDPAVGKDPRGVRPLHPRSLLFRTGRHIRTIIGLGPFPFANRSGRRRGLLIVGPSRVWIWNGAKVSTIATIFGSANCGSGPSDLLRPHVPHTGLEYCPGPGPARAQAGPEYRLTSFLDPGLLPSGLIIAIDFQLQVKGRQAGRRPPNFLRHTMAQSYHQMIIASQEVPVWYNIAAAASSWTMLAGFFVFPGTFTSLKKSHVFNESVAV